MTLLVGFPAGHEDRSGLELAATLARSSGQDLALVSAFVAVSAIPTIIFYLFAERQIVSGLTAGALKG